jgi:hypothetical protein
MPRISNKLTFGNYACNETSFMHYLSSVYSVTITVHVSGLLVAHHHEVPMYICDNWYVLYVLVDCQVVWLRSHSLTRSTVSQLRRTTRTNRCIYTLLRPDDGQLASPKHVQV